MQVYTYSEARQKFSSVLDKAELSGKVLIRRKDGRTFSLVPEKIKKSPLDVPSIKADISTDELVSMVKRERTRSTAVTRLLKNQKSASKKTEQPPAVAGGFK